MSGRTSGNVLIIGGRNRRNSAILLANSPGIVGAPAKSLQQNIGFSDGGRSSRQYRQGSAAARSPRGNLTDRVNFATTAGQSRRRQYISVAACWVVDTFPVIATALVGQLVMAGIATAFIFALKAYFSALALGLTAEWWLISVRINQNFALVPLFRVLIDLVADVLPEWIQFLSMAFALVLLLLNAMRAVLLKAETVASVA